MTNPTQQRSGDDAAVGGLVIFILLWFLWPLIDILTTLAIPTVPTPPRIWIVAIVAPLLLIAATAYLRAPSMLWQVPLQALTFACLVVGISTLVLRARHNSRTTVSICVGYIVAGALLGWVMRDLQTHLFSPHKARKPRN